MQCPQDEACPWYNPSQDDDTPPHSILECGRRATCYKCKHGYIEYPLPKDD